MRSVTPQNPVALPIGELSRRTGVHIETIRYYERIKMLPAPARTASGRRCYGPAETRALTFVRRSRELGFSLDEIRALLARSAEGVVKAHAPRCASSRPITLGRFGPRSPISRRWK